MGLAREENRGRLTSVNGLSYDTFVGPAAIATAIDRVALHAQLARPFSEGHDQTVVHDEPVAPHVVLLGSSRGPSAILWRIRAVVVNAIKRVCGRWAWPHVGIECGEVMKPPTADANAASTIAAVLRFSFSRASSLHTPPNPVLWKPSPPVCFAGTPTTKDVPGSKSRSLADNNRAAVAQASPICARTFLAAGLCGPFFHEKSAETLVLDVNADMW